MRTAKLEHDRIQMLNVKTVLATHLEVIPAEKRLKSEGNLRRAINESDHKSESARVNRFRKPLGLLEL